MLKKIAVIGEGGHAKVIRDIISDSQQYELIAVFDDKFDDLKKEGIYYGPVTSVQTLLQNIAFQVVIAIGNNEIRRNIVERLRLEENVYATLIHSTAVISHNVTIGNGTVIMPNAVVNSNAVVENHVIINTGAVIEHDNRIEDFVHVSPQAALTGSVCVKKGTHIGAGTVVIPGKTIGEWSIIGAGSTVINDIPGNCVAVGTPAKVIKTKVHWEG